MPTSLSAGALAALEAQLAALGEQPVTVDPTPTDGAPAPAPQRVVDMMTQPERSDDLPNDLAQVQAYIRAKTRALNNA